LVLLVSLAIAEIYFLAWDKFSFFFSLFFFWF
jgi:hypothetical protein